VSLEVAEATVSVIEQMADTLRAMGLIGEPVAVAADADAPVRFLGLTGRDPQGIS